VTVDEPASLGDLLRRFRERSLLSQEALAAASGVSVRTIRGLESNRVRRPHAESLRLLAAAFGLSPGEQAELASARAAEPAAAEPRPGLPVPRVVPAQLPADLGDFIGRGQELAELDEAVTQREDGPAATSIALIVGPAGVGKTSLATHWAHRQAARFPDGQLYLNLQGFAPGAPTRPIDALAALLRSLGVGPDAVPLQPEEAAGLYRSLLAGKRMLVVLDNARDTDQVRLLLPGSPGSAAVVTSRDGLLGLVATHGAHRVLLEVLSAAESVDLLVRMVGRQRIGAEPAAGHELARACGHLPLALRVAAANVKARPKQSVAGYVEALRAGGLVAGLEVDGDPQVGVRAAFDLSYQRLPAPLQRVFRLIGLIPGGDFPAAAVAALAGVDPDQALRMLDRLAAAHLVQTPVPDRFSMHDLVREYARNRPEWEGSPQRRREAVEPLLHWYLHTAASAVRLLYPHPVRLPLDDVPGAGGATDFTEPEPALRWLRQEQDNLVAVVTRASTAGPLPVSWLLADTLRSWFWATRPIPQWLATAQAAQVAVHSHRPYDPAADAATGLSLGDAHASSGDYAASVDCYRLALGAARRAGWRACEAAALARLGNVLGDQGELSAAISHHTEALEVTRQIGNLNGEAIALGNLGNQHWELGELQQAGQRQTAALALYRQLGSRVGEANSLSSLGEIAHARGELAEAVRILAEALELYRAVGDRYGQAYALGTLAAVHRDAGRLAEAHRVVARALELAEQIGDQRTVTEALVTTGSIWLLDPAERALERAVQAFGDALEAAAEAGIPRVQAAALVGLSGAALRAGLAGPALEHAERAGGLVRDAGYLVLDGQIAGARARALVLAGRRDAALGPAVASLACFGRSGHLPGQVQALLALAEVYEPGRPGPAAAYRAQAAALTRRLVRQRGPEATSEQG
jgi:tetratricopeptide (TPR) repeat protein